MAIKWKLFQKSFPHVCDKCGALANTERKYCENCGAQNSLKRVTKEDYAKYLKD
ncbi:MAG: hypothetical protein ACTSQU_03160 [Promethearchaeota archaeon]